MFQNSMNKSKKHFKRKMVATIKDATIFEASNMGNDASLLPLEAKDSFEIEFDSAEFDDANLEEGERTLQEHYEMYPHQNFLRQLKLSV